MSTLKTHNLQSPDAGSVNIAMTPNAGMVVAGLSTYSNQINVGSNIKLGTAGVVTATSFVGSGANLTSLPAQATIANNADNRVITGGSGVNLNGEASLTYTTGILEINHTSCQLDLMEDGATDSNHRIRQNAGNLYIQKLSDNKSSSTTGVVVDGGGHVELYYSGTKRIETTNTGAVVTGILTATSFSGNIVAGAGTSNITAGIITATNIELAIPTSRRNFFINGGMYVAARGTVTGLNAGGFGGPDHIKLVNNLGTFTVAQGNEHESPRSEGFTYCYKLNCTSASGPSASNYVYLHHEFSGYDLQLLRYGYTNPHPITISFWAKCNKTGNFTVTFRTVAGVNRLISKVLTISDSNWNFYSVTFVGDTSVVSVTAGGAYILEIWLDGGNNYTGGTVQTSWSAKDNADRGAGSTLNIASSTSNYFYYTGLQIELGTVATPFEHQLYQWYEHECYRFFYHPNRGSDLLELHGMGHRVADTMGAVIQAYPWPRQMRATPTVSFDDNAGNSNRFAVNGSNNSTTNNVLLSLQQNDQGIMGAFQYPHGISGISENESFRLWAYNFKAEAEF